MGIVRSRFLGGAGPVGPARDDDVYLETRPARPQAQAGDPVFPLQIAIQ